MQDCREKISYYGQKCQLHLTRVRLSHEIALRGLSEEQVAWSAAFADLAAGAFDIGPADTQEGKLRRGLSEVHLVALKANFELYLNRIVTAIWTAGFEVLARTVPQD